MNKLKAAWRSAWERWWFNNESLWWFHGVRENEPLTPRYESVFQAGFSAGQRYERRKHEQN